MLSESARMTTRAEARYRIEAPNAQPRAVKVIALDAVSEAVVKRLAQLSWNRASFLTASAFLPSRSGQPADRSTGHGVTFSMPGWLSDLAGRTKNLIDEIASADLVVMIATAGENAQAGSLIGEACGARHVMTTGLVLGTAAASDAALSKTLAQLRPYAMMLVAAGDEDYIEDMLVALRA
jgi:hypothetical protein